jgi:hypothetical protein
MNRKKFLVTTGALSGLFFTRNALSAMTPGQPNAFLQMSLPPDLNLSDTLRPNTQPTRPDPYKTDLVKEFVIAGHGDLTKVQSMLTDHPNLIFGKFDWGNGDFEAAIEGAGHVGNKEIAKFLIDAGARVTLFVLTMLGRTDLVKPVLEAYPKLVFAIGPHGLTMLHHAKAGGKESEELYAYLQEKGLKETWVNIYKP